jgi:hypothetical protein
MCAIDNLKIIAHVKLSVVRKHAAEKRKFNILGVFHWLVNVSLSFAGPVVCNWARPRVTSVITARTWRTLLSRLATSLCVVKNNEASFSVYTFTIHKWCILLSRLGRIWTGQIKTLFVLILGRVWNFFGSSHTTNVDKYRSAFIYQLFRNCHR